MRPTSLTPTSVQQQARYAPRYPPPSQGPSTIDPTQVYDSWPEKQRQANEAAEQRRKFEAEQARKDQIAAEERRKEAEERRKEVELEERRKEHATKLAAEIEAKQKQTEVDEQRKQAEAKSTAAKRQSQLSDAITDGDVGPPGETEMEAEMRAMFQKMRKFNQMNPKMLAKMWEEERHAHVTKTTPAKTSADITTASKPSNDAAKVQEAASTAPAVVQTPPKNNGGRPRKAMSEARKLAAEAASVAAAAAGQQAGVFKATAESEYLAVKPSQTAESVTAPATSATAQPVSQSHAELDVTAQRRKKLAQVALSWLMTRSENSGKLITLGRLVEILESNPTYPVLCERLELMGLFVDKAAFARAIMTGVPDINKPLTVKTDSVQPTATLQQPPPALGASVAQHLNAVAPVNPVPILLEGNLADHITTADTPQAEERPQFSRNLPDGRIMSKREAARKKTLQELVDLTREDSDDEIPMVKRPNVGQYTYRLSTTPPPSDSKTEVGTAPAVQKPPPPPRSNPREAELKGKHIVLGIKRQKAGRKNMYDPRTIARDVLLATGRHPEMRPLNGHLMGMQKLLVDHNSGVEYHKYDLGTLRWDLIDPGDLLPDSEEESALDGDDADDESDNPTANPVNLARAQRATRDLGDGTIAAVSVPVAPRLKPGFRPQKEKKPNGRPPGIRKWLAPGSIPPHQRHIRTHAGNTGPTLTQRGTTAPSRTSVGRPAHASPSSASPAVGYAAFRQTQTDENGQPIKKLGRPVGWRKAIHGKEAQNRLAGGEPAPSVKLKKQPGRPRKSNGSVIAGSSEPVEPIYSTWKCAWDACGAELHNLATLRKHVIKIHGIPDAHGWHHCHWLGCHGIKSSLDDDDDDRTAHAPPPLSFRSIHKWVEHVEAKHLLQLAQTLGDGPRGNLSESYDSEAASAAYLSDATTGRVVTPRLAPLAEADPGFAADAARQALPLAPLMRRGMPRVRGGLSDSQRDDELRLQQLEARKAALGPGWDVGGARIATEERRAGLYDDEEFEGSCSERDGPKGSDGE